MTSQIIPSSRRVAWRAGGGDGRGMGQFLGTHQNRVDTKGRVSIPAAFRAVLRAPAGEGPCTVILRPSHKHACVEAWPKAAFEALAQQLERLDTFSEEHEALSAALYADTHAVESDREGRIVVPERLSRLAGLSDAVVFMGMGRIFHIWEPKAAEAFLAETRAVTQKRGLTLPGTGPAVRPAMAAGAAPA